MTPVSTSATNGAADSDSNSNGALGAPAPVLKDIPTTSRSLSPNDAVPEPFLYRNLEEVANKLGAAPCQHPSSRSICTSSIYCPAVSVRLILSTLLAAASACAQDRGIVR